METVTKNKMEAKVVVDTPDRYEFQIKFLHFGKDIGFQGTLETPYFQNLSDKFSGQELEDKIYQSKLKMQIDVYHDAVRRILEEGEAIYNSKDHYDYLQSIKK